MSASARDSIDFTLAVVEAKGGLIGAGADPRLHNNNRNEQMFQSCYCYYKKFSILSGQDI